MPQRKLKREESDAGSTVQVAILFALVIAVLGGLLFFGLRHVQQQQHTQAIETARLHTNAELKLPEDFPSEIVPIYEGVEIKTSARDTTKSTTGEPMDHWAAHGETTADKEAVFEYYNDLLLKRGMSQTMFASVPNGTSATYADEVMEVQVTAEKKRKDKLTQLDLKISRLVSPPKK